LSKSSSLCGGGVEYLHRDPTTHERAGARDVSNRRQSRGVTSPKVLGPKKDYAGDCQ
jgi:hypothetical protein